VKAVRSAVAALNRGDVDGYLDHFIPTCPRWIPGAAEPLSLTDIGDNFRLLAEAFEPLHLDDDALFGDEDLVCARWRLRGVHVKDYLGFPPHGHSIDVETCEVYQVDGGRVVASWVYGDLNQLFAQITPDESAGT
jgi:limonene-1,2-epoxide hydrolase